MFEFMVTIFNYKKIIRLALLISAILLIAIPTICVASDEAADETVYGDANGDGFVDMADLILIREYIANFNDETKTSTVMVREGADVNGNGFVDSRDLMLLSTYFARYDYDIKESPILLGEFKPDCAYVSGDGAVTHSYSNADYSRYTDTLDYYTSHGGIAYCTNCVGGLYSTTYKGGAVFIP